MLLRDRELADALGWLADGLEVPEDVQAQALAALRGPVRVRDPDSERVYYLQVDTLALENVDTEEAIWSAPADGRVLAPDGALVVDLNDPDSAYQAQVVLLADLSAPARLRALADRWERDPSPERQQAWGALVTRFLDPVVRGVARGGR